MYTTETCLLTKLILKLRNEIHVLLQPERILETHNFFSKFQQYYKKITFYTENSISSKLLLIKKTANDFFFHFFESPNVEKISVRWNLPKDFFLFRKETRDSVTNSLRFLIRNFSRNSYTISLHFFSKILQEILKEIFQKILQTLFKEFLCNFSEDFFRKFLSNYTTIPFTKTFQN